MVSSIVSGFLLVAVSLFSCNTADPSSLRAAPETNATLTKAAHSRHAWWNDGDGDPDQARIQRFLGEQVDSLVVERYKKDPKGYRKHPSYYSETYLRRASLSDSERASLDQQWGKWDFVDDQAASRPNNAFYDQYPNRDVPRKDFPSTAWQTDSKFLAKFLPEAIQLTERAMEAILSEYGRGKADLPNTPFAERSLLFAPHFGTGELGGGGGYMPKASYEGLQRRVLHAVMTQDRFTVAMAGHSAAAGHGNHFQQTYTIQIQRILEPLFARLGVKMSGRNFGMGGLGTLHNTVASGDIYGRDVDCLLWDSSMTEKEKSARGIMAIQALVGIDRAPLLWFSEKAGDILEKVNRNTGADIARYGSNFGPYVSHPVGNLSELEQLPWAIQYMNCPKSLKAYCTKLRYNGTCWEDRSNFEWEGIKLSHQPKTKQQAVPGGRAGWHPGNREHQIQARSFTFTILLALQDVLKRWNSAPNYALEDQAWHVTEYYKSIQRKVEEKKAIWEPWCKDKKISVKFCAYQAKGRTENTPRNRPWATSMRSIIAGSEHPNLNPAGNDYDPPDVYNPTLDPPKGQINVLAIVENGVPFGKNLARIHDSAQDMQGRMFQDDSSGTGSKHKPEIIKGGKGWQFGGGGASVGTDGCDGEHDSWCRRTGSCLLYGHNDFRTGLFMDGYSGWIIFNLPKVEYGVIMIKVHSWAFAAPAATRAWCSENNEKACPKRALSSEHRRLQNNLTMAWDDHASNQSQPLLQERRLKPKVPDYCDDFHLEFAIDGQVTSWNKTQVFEHKNQAQRVVEFLTLLDDDTWTTAKDVELALRLTGCGRQKPFELTHVYWI